MKRNIYQIGFMVVVVQLIPSLSLAQRVEHVSDQEALEYSLMSLKESAQEIETKNEKLMRENASIRETIDQLKVEYDWLGQQKDQLTIPPVEVREDVVDNPKDLNLVQGQLSRLRNEIILLQGEQQTLEQRMQKKSEDVKLIFDQLSRKQEDVTNLRSKIQAAEADFGQIENSDERKRLIGMKQEGEAHLLNLKKQIKESQAKQAKPLKIYSGLKQQYRTLKQNLALLNDQIEQAAADETRMREEIDQIEKNKGADLGKLDEEIAALQGRYAQLEQTLVDIQAKMAQNNFDVNNYSQQNENLEQDLVILKRENQILREKFGAMQRQLGDSHEK